MERDAVSFAIKHDRTEAEWCDRMSGRKHFAAVFLDRVDSLVETAIRIEVNQRSTFRRPGVYVQYEAATDRTLGMRQHGQRRARSGLDRKSTRLNSSHGYISYAVFCLKKKK